MSEKEQIEKEENLNEETVEATEQEEVETEKDPLEELQGQYNELNNKYLRLYSDFENFRKRTASQLIALRNVARACEAAFVSVSGRMPCFKCVLFNIPMPMVFHFLRMSWAS